jgi:hypothetical protein
MHGIKTCCGFDMQKFKWSGCMTSSKKHAVECKSLKDNYSTNLKSMN